MIEVRVRKIGNSIGIVIPSEAAKIHGIKAGDVVEIKKSEKKQKTCGSCAHKAICKIRDAMLRGVPAGEGSEELIERAINGGCALYEEKE